MAGMTVTIDDPEIVETKSVDSNGRLFLGKEYEGAEVRVAIEVIEYASDEPESGEKEEQDAEDSDDVQSDSDPQESGMNTDNEDSEDKDGGSTSWLQDSEDST